MPGALCARRFKLMWAICLICVCAGGVRGQTNEPAEFVAGKQGDEGLIYNPDPRTTIGDSGTIELSLALPDRKELGGDVRVVSRGEDDTLDFEVVVAKDGKHIWISNGAEKLEVFCDFLDGQFHHVAFCIGPGGSPARVYVDGDARLQSANRFRFRRPDDALRQRITIGGASRPPPSRVQVQFCRFWNRELTLPECKGIRHTPGKPPFTSGLVAWTLYTADERSLVLGQSPLTNVVAGLREPRPAIALLPKDRNLGRLFFRVNSAGVVDDIVLQWNADRDRMAYWPRDRAGSDLSAYSSMSFDPGERLIGFGCVYDGQTITTLSVRTTKGPPFRTFGRPADKIAQTDTLAYVEVPPDGTLRGIAVGTSSAAIGSIGLLYSMKADEDPGEAMIDEIVASRFVDMGATVPEPDDALAWAVRDEDGDAHYILAQDLATGESVQMPDGKDILDENLLGAAELQARYKERQSKLVEIEFAMALPAPPVRIARTKSANEKVADFFQGIGEDLGLAKPREDPEVAWQRFAQSAQRAEHYNRVNAILNSPTLAPWPRRDISQIQPGPKYGEECLCTLRQSVPFLQAASGEGASIDFKERLATILMGIPVEQHVTLAGLARRLRFLNRDLQVGVLWKAYWKHGVPEDLLPYRLSLRPHGLFTSQTVYTVQRERGTSRLRLSIDNGRRMQVVARPERTSHSDLTEAEKRCPITPDFPRIVRAFSTLPEACTLTPEGGRGTTRFASEHNGVAGVARLLDDSIVVESPTGVSIDAVRVRPDISEPFPDKIPWGGTFSLGERPALVRANFKGYNGRDLSPREVIAGADSGRTVFAYPSDMSDDYRTTDNKLIVPDGLMLIMSNVSEESNVITSTTKVSEHEDTAASSVGTKTSVHAGVSAEGVGASFDFSTEHKSEMNRLTSELQRDESSIDTGLATQIRYSLVVDMSRIRLGDEFVSDVQGIRDAYVVDQGDTTDRRIARLVAAFGTHYAYAITYGGECRFDQVITATAWEQIQARGLSQTDVMKIGVEASGSYDGVGGSVGFSHEQSKTTGSGTKDVLKSELRKSSSRFTTLGGSMSRGGGWSLGHGEEVPIRYDLRPISELLSPTFFDDPLIYENIRKRVELAIAKK